MKPSLIEIPQIGNSEMGFLSFIEEKNDLPFPIKRVYWTYNAPSSIIRGGHAHKTLEQLIFAVSGVINISFEGLDGEITSFKLDKPNVGVYVPKLFWRDIQFSENAVLLCLASQEYIEDDYIRDFGEFKKLSNCI